MTVKIVDANRLMDNARVALPGALDGAIWQEIFNTFSEFCDRSNAWYDDITFTPVSGALMGDLVDIQPTCTARINRLIYVAFIDNENNVFPKNMSMPRPGTLQYGSPPDSTSPWTARVALCPTDPVATSGSLQGIPRFPDWLLQQYHNGLLAGVLARMMIQPAKPYTNTKMALVHRGLFQNAISQAKTEFRKQNLFNGQCWQFPQAGTARTR